MPRVNPFRVLLGDEAVRLIHIVSEGDWEHDRRELARLFPEETTNRSIRRSP